ncbi:hypothetical protein CERSUDRAFT_83363 [Gelatoporia subvermispora B]|uniref:PPM-type phosphatase domain-containing protein n=1 Tax=Ceriporiopsis subvermispora (strain B) TaxID=914234 RepID=M2QKQ8_CERS8|nr:hypothetical protein CERSUDRAFT_83363 [Gelatoporia subvermispora B]
MNSDTPLPAHLSFKCAVTDSKGPRRSMEDAHSILVPFAGIHGQGFFAIFDGHAGKHAAEWCGENFAKVLLDVLRRRESMSIPDVLNKTFHDVDSSLSQIAVESEGRMHSGCTAVTAFLRLEDAQGQQSFVPHGFDPLAADIPTNDDDEDENGDIDAAQPRKHKGLLRSALSSIGGSSNGPSHRPSSPSSQIFMPPSSLPVRRVLYCANAGDARGVLCRGGRGIRLTYDHKGSDKQEAKRIMDAGGFVMSGRVNGVLAVTRSLGDSSMKEYVVGAPYTTETELCEEDEFLILACDGLWDVIEDQKAVELVRGVADPRKAAQSLLEHAYENYSTDNVTVLVVRFRNPPESVRDTTV